jgi:tripartite-type tricarboxylate transporter receptor subunit TctC
MVQKLWPFACVMALVLASRAPAGTIAPFYEGKTVRIIVGFAAGGGFDTYTRAIARHLGRHIPGSPAIVVENMTGAGSLIAANHVYKVAKPDGLTVGHFIGGLLIGQVLGRPGAEFDARRFEYVGVPVKDKPVCVLTKASGTTTMEEWLAAKAPVKLGGTAPGSTTDDVPKILHAALGLPLQLVSGYKGTADIRLAAEGGEVHGGCWGWDSIRATWSQGLDAGDIVPVLQALPQPHPDLPTVPLAIDFAKTDEARQLIHTGIYDVSALVRPYVLPPGTPKERVQIMRQAFMETLQEAAFLDDARRAKLDIEPVPGDELEQVVARLFELPPTIVARLKQVLDPK